MSLDNNYTRNSQGTKAITENKKKWSNCIFIYSTKLHKMYVQTMASLQHKQVVSIAL